MTSKIEKLEKLLSKATPGDWQTPTRACEYFGETMIALTDTYDGYQVDCKLICALRNSAPLLLEIVKAAITARSTQEPVLVNYVMLDMALQKFEESEL